MAYVVGPAKRARPGSVTAAGAALFLAAAALVAVAVAQFSIIPVTGDAVDAVSTGSEDEGVGKALTGILFGGGGALNLATALTLAILAGFDLAGKRAARVMSWIVAPLAVLCCGCPSALYTDFVFDNASAAAEGAAAGGGELTEEQFQAIGAAIPAYFTPAVLIGFVIVAICALAAIVLLAVPSSNDYFRRPPAFAPPGWPGGYPGGYQGGYQAGYPGTYPPPPPPQDPQNPQNPNPPYNS